MPYIFAEEPYIFAEEPCISGKEPHVFAQKPIDLLWNPSRLTCHSHIQLRATANFSQVSFTVMLYSKLSGDLTFEKFYLRRHLFQQSAWALFFGGWESAQFLPWRTQQRVSVCWLCVLQCGAVCCSVLQCVAVVTVTCMAKWCAWQRVSVGWLCMSQCGAVCCSSSCNALQCVAACCSVLQRVAVPSLHHDVHSKEWVGVRCSVLQCAAICCFVLQCVTVCCSVL